MLYLRANYVFCNPYRIDILSCVYTKGNESHEELEYKLKLSIFGPSHISLSLAPLQTDSIITKLRGWSLQIPVNDVERNPSAKQPLFNGYVLMLF